MHFAANDTTHLLQLYGYWAVLIFAMLESAGIPVPGETMLIAAGLFAAGLFAGATHHLQIELVIAAAAFGAILGDNLGYFVGREGGYRLLPRYGHTIRLDEGKLKLGQYLFQQHGESRLLRPLCVDAAGLGGPPGRGQPHALAAVRCGQCRGRHPLGDTLRARRLRPRQRHPPPGRSGRLGLGHCGWNRDPCWGCPALEE